MVPYFFNTRTGAVEELENKSQVKDLLGPYATREEAERALQTARARTEAWDQEDAEWEERGRS
ncbi:MAG TPA: SPOR domain-containing protein [Actinomycetales bacterium]|nr:SPOR domain-containing protein [Actinomycetales bacterium]